MFVMISAIVLYSKVHYDSLKVNIIYMEIIFVIKSFCVSKFIFH